jgi:hypothetical protein
LSENRQRTTTTSDNYSAASKQRAKEYRNKRTVVQVLNKTLDNRMVEQARINTNTIVEICPCAEQPSEEPQNQQRKQHPLASLL